MRKPDLMCRRRRRGGRPTHERLVTDDGRYVVVIDRYAGERDDAALTIYGESERRIRAFEVRELLTPEEIERRADERIRWGWWTRGVLFDLSIDCKQLTLMCDDSRRTVIDLETGELFDSNCGEDSF